MTIIKKRVVELIQEINQHNIYYYTNDNPIISDSEYDELVRELIQIEKKNPPR